MRYGYAALILAVGLVPACGGNSGSGVNPTPTLQGTWRATRAQFVSVAAPIRQVDIVPQGGTVTMTFTATNYSFTQTETGKAQQAHSGTWTGSTDMVTLRPTGVTWTIEYDMALAGNTLTLSGGSVQYDFTPGVLEEARLNLTMARQ